jgi:hypothetical protein
MSQGRKTNFIQRNFSNSFDHFRKKVIKTVDVENYCRKTLDQNFKGAVFNYLSRVLYSNQQNGSEFAYKILKEPLMSNQMVIYMKRYFFLLDEINEKINIMISSGIIDFIVSKYADRHIKANSKPFRQTKLTMNHLQGIFQVWCFCLILAFIVFVCEMF